MKRSIIAFFLLLASLGYSQNTINNYKFVIVPVKFTFLKADDQYLLNSLTKSLLEAKGFTVFFDNSELPAEIASNTCRALTADVLDKGGMFTTNLELDLKDCYGHIVFKSKTGKSREKEYNASYNMALRDAFTSLDQLPYSYTEPASAPVQAVAAAATAVTPAVTEMQTPATLPAKTVTATSTVASPAATEKPMPATVPAKTGATNDDAGTLYAQSIPNGYQLVDNTPKKVLTLLKTSVDTYFIASTGTVNGVVLKINEDWFFEYYENGKFVSKKLLVKF